MNDLIQKWEGLINKHLPEIKKIKNYKKLLNRFTSTDDVEQKEDAIAELEVALHHIMKNHFVEYEPNLANPPEFRVATDRIEFFVEVKRVRRHKQLIKQEKIMEDLKKRIRKIQLPYILSVMLNYPVVDISKNKKIATFIKRKLETFNNQDFRKPIEIIINSTDFGHFRVFKSSKNRCEIVADFFTWWGIEDNIYNQFRESNKKTIPSNKPFFVILKLPWHVNELEIEYGTRGKESVTYFLDKITGEIVGHRVSRINKIFGHLHHYKRISASILYRYEFREENAVFDLNERANCKIDASFIKKFYF